MMQIWAKGHKERGLRRETRGILMSGRVPGLPFVGEKYGERAMRREDRMGKGGFESWGEGKATVRMVRESGRRWGAWRVCHMLLRP